MENKMINRVIPDGEMNCIWVEAGLVSYKLCDRNFECEDCPFDQVMHRQSHPSSMPLTAKAAGSVEAKIEEKAVSGCEMLVSLLNGFFALPMSVSLPADRSYLRNHVWVMKEQDNIYRIGLDHYAAFLLESLGSVILSPRGASQAINNPLAWMICEDGTVAVRSPLSGRVVRSNFQLKDSAALIKNDPYGKGWISDLEVTDGENTTRRFLNAQEIGMEYSSQMEQFKHEIIEEYQHVPSLGVTLLDGGTRTRNLRDFLGPQKLLFLLQKMLAIRT